MAAPKAITRAFISLKASILSMVVLSTFKILPLSGRMACVLLSRPCLPEPPAESPSTMNISASLASRVWQSASLPGKVSPSQNAFSQYAFFGGFGGLPGFERQQNFGNYGSSVSRIFFQEKANASPKTDSTAVLASGLPSLALVCPSN